MKTLAVCVAVVFLALGLTGCTAWTSRPPVEAFADKFADEAVIPAVREGLAQGVRHLTIQAGAQGINPAYVAKVSGKWVVGLECEVSVGAEGVAGQMQVSSAAREAPQE